MKGNAMSKEFSLTAFTKNENGVQSLLWYAKPRFGLLFTKELLYA
jgi:hypothetical protein